MKKTSMFLFSVFIAFFLSTTFVHALTSNLNLWQSDASSATLHPKNVDISPASVSNFSTLKNNDNGYQLDYPTNWQVDSHDSPYYVRFFDGSFRLDVTYDSYANTYQSYDQIIQNTISAIQSSIVYQNTFTTKLGYAVKNVDYERPKLGNISNDLNDYSYFFLNTTNGIYTFQLKTNDINWASMKTKVGSLLDSFTLTNTKIVTEPSISTVSPSISYKGTTGQLTIPSNKVVFGTYEGNNGSVSKTESLLNSNIGAQMFYKPLDSMYDSNINDFSKDGMVSLVTFHLQALTVKPNQPIENELLSGAFDSYLKSWADGIKQNGSPIFVRIGNEMNGKWTLWSSPYEYNDPDLYKLSFHYIVDFFRNEGVTNAYFVWNPNNASDPNYSWNNATLYYPGDDVVDWIGLTAYNFGTNPDNFNYFDDLYQNLYHEYMINFPNKPMMIGEFASVENNGNKAYFVSQMFKKIQQNYPNLKLVIWFNDLDGTYNFPFASSPESLFAFKEGIQSSVSIRKPISQNAPNGLDLSFGQNDVTANSFFSLTGVAQDPAISNVYINGKKEKFLWTSWRQFDDQITLKKGDNPVQIEVDYSNGTTQTFAYNILKDSSYKFTTPVSEMKTDAPVTALNNLTFTGVVKNSSIQTLEVNGINTPIQYNWRQFDVKLSLQDGLNEVVLKGFDINHNLISTESVYLFKSNSNSFKLSSPSKTSTKINGLTYTVTGMAPNSAFSWVKVNGINQTLKWSWRQFDQPLTINYGHQETTVDSLYHSTLNNQDYYYPFHNSYSLEGPNYQWLSSVGYSPSTAVLSDVNTVNVSGIVKNKAIQYMKINGNSVSFLYNWQQFSVPVTLQKGMNKVVVEGYSDSSYTHKIMEDDLYYFNDQDLVITNPKGNYQNIFSYNFTITGMLKDPGYKTVWINSNQQTIQYSWRQFDQPVTLMSRGNNTIPIKASYQGIIDGASFQYTVKKNLILHIPSFDFSSKLGLTPQTAYETSDSSYTLNGYVKDNTVQCVKVNNNTVPIQGSTKQITVPISLQVNMNIINLKGFSDTNCTNLLFSEDSFVFQDSGMTISSPNATNVASNWKEYDISGYLAYSNFKDVKVNGTLLPFLHNWRDFDTKIPLQIGTNMVQIQSRYEDTYNGETYSYYAMKNFLITASSSATSYEMTTNNFGLTPDTAYHTLNSTEWIGVNIHNPLITSMRVNGIQTAINTWRQISYGVTLQKGLNTIVINGYNSSNQVVESKTIYIYR